MGWLLDIVAAVIILFGALYIAYKFGITFSDMQTYFHHFFGFGLVFGFTANSKKREKAELRKEGVKRNIFSRFLRRTEVEAKEETDEEQP